MSMTVLVIDDNAANLTLITYLLKKVENVIPVSFSDPLLAFAWCESNTPDLVLVDYMMPKLNGMQFVSRFRALPQKINVPIIMVTASIDREVRLQALELTINDFLTKPLDSIEFILRVRNMLALRKIQLQLEAASNEALRSQQRQYQTVIEASNDGFFVINLQAEFVQVNAAFCQLTEYSHDELLHMRITDLDALMSIEQAQEKTNYIVANGQARFESELRTRSGRQWPCEVNASYLPGETPSIYVFVHDIQSRKQAEDQLRKLSQAVEQNPNSIIISDTDGIIEYINAAFTQITGYSAEEIIGHKAGFIKSGQTPETLYEALWQTLQRGEIWQGEFINRRKNGELFNDFSIISPIRQADGRITHYLSIQKDITERKRIEQEIESYRHGLENLVLQRTQEFLEAKTQAETANQAKSEFLANISHEIRTPMNAIIGFNSLCLRTELSPQQKDYLTKIGSASQSLLKLINEILDLSKIEAGQISLESIPINIKNLFNKIIDLVKYDATKKGVGLSINIAPKLLIYTLLGDPQRLKQVLLNLCSNAIKFSHQGCIKLNVEIALQESEAITLRFSVQDQGIGIAPAQQEKLFKPFSQADASTTRNFGGTGLGLSICKGLVEKMGGHIWLESEAGIGSTFYFTARLPLNDRAAPVVDEPQSEASLPHWEGKRVLLVEDNEFNQQIASEMLSEFGLKVELAENGLQAIQKIETETFDLVLMDIQMPVMDGCAATQHIRKQTRFDALPIVALTANVMSHERTLYEQFGMNDTLAKPLELSALLASLTRWLPKPDLVFERAQAEASPKPIRPPESIELPSYPGINSAPVIQRMRGNINTFKRFVSLFPTQFSEAILPLQQALNQQDFATARRLAHTIKGAAATIGAEHLSECAGQLEASCKSNPNAAKDLLPAVDQALKIVINGIKDSNH
jgi:two-component system sensor histidine kinase/response regulator